MRFLMLFSVLKWELIWTRSFNAPILSLSSLDLTGDGIEEIAVATTRGLQILQHDITKVQVKPVRPINQFLIWKAAQTLKYRDLVAPAKKFICSPSSFCHLRLHLLRREWEKLNNEVRHIPFESLLAHHLRQLFKRFFEPLHQGYVNFTYKVIQAVNKQIVHFFVILVSLLNLA